MNIDSILERLSNQISELSQKLDIVLSEKSVKEDPTMVLALNEAKRGNIKALQEAAKRRHECRRRKQ